MHSFIQQVLSTPSHLYFIFNQSNKSIYFFHESYWKLSLFQTHPSLFVLAGSVPLSPSFFAQAPQVETALFART